MKINLITYDGSGQTCHPSVINIGHKWCGYQYWMANTPLPGGINIYENPSIWGSNDGENFEVPEGVVNPIIPKPDVNGGFNADTELFFENDTLYLAWKEEVHKNRLTKICSTSDCVHWSEPKIILPHGLDETEKVSPSLIKIGNKYYCYYYSHYTNTTRRVSCDTIDGEYSNIEEISMPFAGIDYIWWHFDITFLLGYYWICAVKTRGTQAGEEIWMMRSDDALNFSYPRVMLFTPYDNLYRPSLVMIGNKPTVYYGAVYLKDGKEEWSCRKADVMFAKRFSKL
jgi:hypothetical protein